MNTMTPLDAQREANHLKRANKPPRDWYCTSCSITFESAATKPPCRQCGKKARIQQVKHR